MAALIDDVDCPSETKEEDAIRLCESIFLFPKKKISDHGNVFEGEIRSGVYGVRPCVIKFAEISEQNISEARILSILSSHTNVIAIIQSGTYSDMLEDRVYIALDRCHSKNLRQYLLHRKVSQEKFDLDQALNFSNQIIEGVTYIHDNKVIHLDLKPSNILLSLSLRLIKIADFGSSVEIKSSSTKIFHKGQFGTNGYRPIESFGDDWVSSRSDIFSLGAVLFHLLSNGEELFGIDEHKFIYNVKNELRNASGLLVSNAKTTEHLIKYMTSKERYRRPTIQQVADHPCWQGYEVECNFDYGCEDEIEDLINQGETIAETQKPGLACESENDMAKYRRLLKALGKMGFNTVAPQTSIAIFDDAHQYLYRFNPKNNSIKPMLKLNEEMKARNYVAVSLDDYIYVLISKVSLYRLKYNDKTASWERMADLPNIGFRPPVTASSGAIYVVGASAKDPNELVSTFDPSLNQWETLPGKQLPSYYSAIVASRNHVYVVGGFIKTTATPRVERWDCVSRSWDEVSPLNTPRYHASAVECSKSIFVAGGVCRDLLGDRLSSMEKYNPETDQWTAVKAMIQCRRSPRFSCHSVGKNIYAVGDGQDDDSTIEKYNLEKDEWEEIVVRELRIYTSISIMMK